MNAYNLIAVPAQNWDQAGETYDSGLFWDQGFPVAQGVQLDVIGKYVGVDRYYSVVALENYTAMIAYSEVAMPPSSPPRYGMETYATFGEYNANGTLTYSDIVTTQNALSDADFLTMIRLAILRNNMNFSHSAIDNALFEIFGDSVRAESNGNMFMAIFITGPMSALLSAIIFKKLLPRPMAVGLGVVTGITGDMFGFTDYSGAQSPYASGFSTYSNYATLPGQVLTYSQIAQG